MPVIADVTVTFSNAEVVSVDAFAEKLTRMSVCDGMPSPLRFEVIGGVEVIVRLRGDCREQLEKMAARAEQYRRDDVSAKRDEKRAELRTIFEESAAFWRGNADALQMLLLRLKGETK